MDKIRVAFGYEDKQEFQKVNPNEETNYAHAIIFDQKLVKELNNEGIETLDQLMEEIP